MPSLIELEITRRLDAWDLLCKSPNWPLLTAKEVRDCKLYGGASGVWVDKSTTCSIADDGVAVGLLHTGRHYDDDVDETGILYHYPTTDRTPSRDASEIQSIKNAKLFGIPVFVIRNIGNYKKVELAWVNDYDDQLRICVMTFQGFTPDRNKFLLEQNNQGSTPILFGTRRKSKIEIERAERDPLFKFQILKRFEGKCLVTGIDVTEMLDAAHIIPVANGGTEDPNNGILLTAGLHRALDAGLWAIHPKKLIIETMPQGPDALRMRITRIDLSGQKELLNREALTYRYEKLFISNPKFK